ncbi:unnamed protein product [Didymodactylos carnosus]|uniref:Uncharacterized protein n=1 Tax=Didymodactylos carnosus TaxID=1234261 RepID=A0A813WTJ8_9BILA|nr:unnamed protein product [Didymodactylos carnosus]CAF1055095.1 unnamed protein product [Didymodactylos carnosus]CAF3647237.1 unnamed protein product [Didymodactylos carnosus]CAF3821386.1 unnamed protein product [Didymodactylos carnosus]
MIVYKNNLISKLSIKPNEDTFLKTLEQTRQEQRLQLAKTEHDYYQLKDYDREQTYSNHSLQEQLHATQSYVFPYHEETLSTITNNILTTKPPLPDRSRNNVLSPKRSTRSPSPGFITEDQNNSVLGFDRQRSQNILRHDEDHSDCPHRTKSHVNYVATNSNNSKKHIHTMGNEFESDDYLYETSNENRHSRSPSAPVSSSWAGRATVPEPFNLTNSMAIDNIHRRKCMHEIEVDKIQKEVDDEINLGRSFRANPVPTHVNLPLYEKIKQDQRLRRENARYMTKEYLHSISKPFSFDSREKTKLLLRRHSFSGDLRSITQQSHFKAKPLPDFYYKTSKDLEQTKEQELHRHVKKQMRAKELLRQSKLPDNMRKRQQKRSLSANDLSRKKLNQLGLQEYSFKPKTNGYYIPNYDKMHRQFISNMESSKQLRSPTKCKPFLLYTNLIPSKKEKILNDIKNDEQIRRSQTFQIKGKQVKRAASANNQPDRKTTTTIKSQTFGIKDSGLHSSINMNVNKSISFEESIPTKMTESQRLRESVNRKKRHDDEKKELFEKSFQQSRSMKDRRLREKIREKAKLNDKSLIHKTKNEQKMRNLRQSMRRSNSDYAEQLDKIQERVERRPLLLEQHSQMTALKEVEKKIQHAMKIGGITENDLMRLSSNPSDV